MPQFYEFDSKSETFSLKESKSSEKKIDLQKKIKTKIIGWKIWKDSCMHLASRDYKRVKIVKVSLLESDEIL